MKYFKPLAVLSILLAFSGCHSCAKPGAAATVTVPAEISGTTMGTTYAIKVSGNIDESALKKIKIDVVRKLASINNEMSTYIATSNISQFNEAGAGDSHLLPKDMHHVVKKAMEIGVWTGGAYDITLDPLVNLWGFDRDGRVKAPPSEEDIARAKEATGHDKIQLKDGVLTKLHKKTSINLSGIAKGFAVDAISELLESAGVFDYMVEIGGEMRVSRQAQDAQPWKIGIASPLNPTVRPRAVGVLPMKNGALASSGVGLNSFAFGGKNYAHILDPQTAYPVETELVSVSVVAPDCTTADALSTSAIVMGEEKFRAMIAARPGIEALFIYLNPAGDSVRMTSTAGFEMN